MFKARTRCGRTVFSMEAQIGRGTILSPERLLHDGVGSAGPVRGQRWRPLGKTHPIEAVRQAP